MQEVFYEESVSVHNEKPVRLRYRLFTIFGILFFLSAALALIFLWGLMLTPVGEETELNAKTVLLSMLPYLVMFVLMLAGGIFLFVKRHSFYVSYDYTFVSGELRISKVLHGRKRKLLYRISDEKYIKIGRVGSESYKKLKSSPDVKEDILTPNEDAADDKEFYYIQAATNVGKKLLVLECRQELLANILRYTRRNLLESEFNRK